MSQFKAFIYIVSHIVQSPHITITISFTKSIDLSNCYCNSNDTILAETKLTKVRVSTLTSLMCPSDLGSQKIVTTTH